MSLRKEMFVAIVLGLLLGGAVAFGFAKVSSDSLSQTSQEITPTPEQQAAVSPTPFLEESMTLEILLPEQQSFINEESITVSGKTKPTALVIITSPVDENVTVADDDGTFSAEIDLSEGANELFIASIFNDQEIKKTVIVNYSKDEI